MNIKKKLFFVVALLNIAGVSQAMKSTKETLVKLPSAQILNKRLKDMESLQHYLEKTRIDKELGDQELHPMGVVLSVELSLYNYAQSLKNPLMETLMQMRKPDIVKAILQDSPQAISELEKQGFFQKR